MVLTVSFDRSWKFDDSNVVEKILSIPVCVDCERLAGHPDLGGFILEDILSPKDHQYARDPRRKNILECLGNTWKVRGFYYPSAQCAAVIT